MKKKSAILLMPLIVLVVFSFKNQTASVTGAWQVRNGTVEQVLIFQDGYFSHSQFDKLNKKFIHTNGGTYKIADGKIIYKIEFDTKDKELVGTEKAVPFNYSFNKLILAGADGINQVWDRIDDGTGSLAGNWRISGRMNNGTMQPVQRSARKTLKLLSATRFQWMAINIDTKEFFGTGGGTYTFKDGKYTENIEFFSRDSSRVGASLTFDGAVNNNVWTHKGLNSRGEPLHEEWSREQ